VGLCLDPAEVNRWSVFGLVLCPEIIDWSERNPVNKPETVGPLNDFQFAETRRDRSDVLHVDLF
jgi:hypothetical protein